MSDGKPKNLFYHKLENVTTEGHTKSNVHDILTLVDLILYKNKEVDVASIHQLLGPDLFVDLLHVLGGKTITFPTIEEFRDIFTWALCYYAKEIQHKEWKDIKEELGEDISSIKWSMKNKQLTQFIQEILHRKLSGEDVTSLFEDLKQRKSTN